MTLVVGLLLAGLVLLKQFPDDQRRALSLAGKASLIWVLSCAALFVFGLSVAAALAVPEAVKGELPARFAGTRFGQAVLAQGALALGTSVLALAGKGRRKLAVLSAGLAGLALFAPGSWGHAGTSKLLAIAIASDWAHLAAVTTWVGGLVVLATMVLPRSSTIEPAAPAQRFSKLAGVAVVVVLVSGAVNAAMRIDSPGQLLSTEWGKLVLLKLLLFAGIAFLGYRNRSRMLPALAADPDTARAGFRKLALLEVGIMLLSLSTATALASTIPADAEAASRIQSIATTFGPGQINLTVDPAAVGENVMHLYFLDPAGQPLEVTEPSVSLAMPGTTLEARLFQAGPGHYTVLSQTIDRAGTYSVAVTATVDGGRQTATGTVEIR
jgi:putative copper export protein